MPIRYKKEGTSQTWGQLIEVKSTTSTSPVAAPSTGGTSVSIVVSDTESVVLSDQDKAGIATSAASKDKPLVTTNSVNSETPGASVPQVAEAVVAGSSVNTQAEIQQALTEAQKVDLSITLKSPESDVVEYNNLKIPDLKSQFIYNFYEPNETYIGIQENPATDPLKTNQLKDIPRYVELRWETVVPSEPMKLSVEDYSKIDVDLKQEVLVSPTKKKPPLIKKEQSEIEVTDIHEQDKAFESVGNKGFKNTISAIVSPKNKPGSISTLPVKREKGKDE